MKEIEVNRPWIPPRDELYRLFDDILDSRELTNNSKYVKLLEAELAARTNVPHVYTASNGTMALHLAIRALGLEKGEIITTPFSFVATSSSIMWEGYRPVFVEIEQETLNVNADLIEERITPATRALLFVHVFGNTCDIGKIDALADKHGLPVIYDAAHAFGVRYKGKSVFEYGAISTLSMHASKIVSSVEGGALFCRDEQLADRIFKLRYFGKDMQNREVMIGINGKMNEFNAAFGLLSLRNFEKEVLRRRTIAEMYNAAFEGKDFIYLLDPLYNDNSNYAYYPVILPSEEMVFRYIKKAAEQDIIIRRYWHPSINTIEYIGADPSETPISVRSAECIVCLPIYSGLSDDDVHRVIALFRD